MRRLQQGIAATTLALALGCASAARQPTGTPGDEPRFASYRIGIARLARESPTERVAAYCVDTGTWTDLTLDPHRRSVLMDDTALIAGCGYCQHMEVYHTHQMQAHIDDVASLPIEQRLVGWSKDLLIRGLPSAADLISSVRLSARFYQAYPLGSIGFGTVTDVGTPDLEHRTEREVVPRVVRWRLDPQADAILHDLANASTNAPRIAISGMRGAIDTYAMVQRQGLALLGEGYALSLKDVCAAASDRIGFTFTCTTGDGK